MLTLTYPLALVLLPLPALAYRLLPPYRQAQHAVRAPFFDRLLLATGTEAATEAPPQGRRPIQRRVLLGLCWGLVVCALAKPVWLEDPIVQELPKRDLLVALDLSGSMETIDFTDDTGALQDRLTAARQVLDAFLAERDGDRVGLIFFGTAAFVQAPLTQDLEVVRELLREASVRMLGPRTAIGDAMGLAIHLFERSEVEERVLIVLTDGNDTGSLVPPTRAAEIARDSGVVIHTIAMGDPAAAGEQALDEETLRAVAETTGGGFFRAMDRDALQAVYARIDELNPRQVETLSYRPEQALHAWPIAMLLVLTLGGFGLRELALAARRRWQDLRGQAARDPSTNAQPEPGTGAEAGAEADARTAAPTSSAEASGG